MTQFYTDDTGQRYLPVLSPYQAGIGTSGVENPRQRTRDFEDADILDFQDVVELEREPGSFVDAGTQAQERPAQPQLNAFLQGGGAGFNNARPNFSVDRDVVANIYASNASVSSSVNPGGNLNLVA